MPQKQKIPQSTRSKRQKNLDFQEKKRKNIEVSSNSQSPNDSKPLQTESHVTNANSCNNNESTGASLRLKRKREQSYEAYHEDPQAKCNKVKATYDRNPQVKRSQVKAAFNKDHQAKQNKVKAAFDKDRAKKRAQMKALYDRNPQVKRANGKACYWRNPATKRVASKLLDRAKRALNSMAKKMKNKAYYKKNCMKLKAVRKARYLLKEPKRIDSFRYLKKLKISLRAIEYEVASCFRRNYSYAVGLLPTTLCTTSCRVTATKLLHYALE